MIAECPACGSQYICGVGNDHYYKKFYNIYCFGFITLSFKKGNGGKSSRYIRSHDRALKNSNRNDYHPPMRMKKRYGVS